jgi:hypothetical protein
MVRESGAICFSYPERANLRILDGEGRSVADLGWGTAFAWDYTTGKQCGQAGTYFAQLRDGNHLLAGKQIFLP